MLIGVFTRPYSDGWVRSRSPIHRGGDERLGGGGSLAGRHRPEHRDSLTEEDTARAAVHKRVSGIARPVARGRHREAANEPDARSVTLAG